MSGPSPDPTVGPLITAGATLAGIVVGWALGVTKDAVQRHWQRIDKNRDLSIQRGEELLQQCHDMYVWSEDARRKAFEGDINVPVPTAAFRIAAIVELYYPALTDRSRNLDVVTQDYRVALVDIAEEVRKGTNQPEKLKPFHEAHQKLLPAIGLMLEDARQAVRAELK